MMFQHQRQVLLVFIRNPIVAFLYIIAEALFQFQRGLLDYIGVGNDNNNPTKRLLIVF
jgi:hypothetical protein